MAKTLTSHILDSMVHALGPSIYDNNRECYTCGRIIGWIGFLNAAECNNDLEKFGLDLLKEIWDNEIFVLNCCTCHTGKPQGIIGWINYQNGWYHNE